MKRRPSSVSAEKESPPGSSPHVDHHLAPVEQIDERGVEVHRHSRDLADVRLRRARGA